MQGIMFIELSRFIDERLGSGEWERTLAAAGLSDRTDSPREPGPDEEFLSIVNGVAPKSGEPVQSILESFGEFIARVLRGGPSWRLLAEGWGLFQFLEHTEGPTHAVSRAPDPAAAPPRLRTVRSEPDEVLIFYDSPRRMCSVAKGIVRGAANHFGERVELIESRCMLAGAPRCEITVRRSRS